MSRKSKLIILDADIVIDFHRLGLWDKVVKNFKIHLSREILDESMFYTLSDGTRKYIRIQQYIDKGLITIIDLDASELPNLMTSLREMQAPNIDAGELEALAAVLSAKEDFRVCLQDRAAIHAAVLIGLRERCVSGEALLAEISANTKVPPKLSIANFERVADAAQAERVTKLKI